MSKLLKKLCLVGIALIIVLITASMALGRGNDSPPVDPKPPTVYGIGGGGR